jgi:predicted PurR-regulated permease PerM
VQRDRRSRNVGWRSRDILRTAALVMLMYVLLRLLWFAQTLVFTAFLGILFGLAVSSGVDRLARWRIPRGLGAAIIVLGTLGLLGGLGAWMAPTLREQSAQLRVKLPEAVDKIQLWVERHRGGVLGALLDAGDATTTATGRAATGAADAVAGRSDQGPGTGAGTPAGADSGRATAPSPQPGAAAAGAGRDEQRPAATGRSSLRDRLFSLASGARRFFFGFVTSTIAAITGVVLVLVLAIYIAADPDLYHRGLMHVVPFGGRRRAGEVLSAMAQTLRKWLVTQLIAMLVIGAVTTGVLLALGIEAALPLGIIAGLLEFVPTVGPIISAIPAVAMGFVDSPEKALWVALAYVAIQQMENHLLIPFLMKSGVDLPPALTIMAQALMALVFGFLGLLVAVPLLAAVM